MRAHKKIRLSTLSSQAEKALKRAVRHVIEEHKRTGLPVVVWRSGKVVKVPANLLARQ